MRILIASIGKFRSGPEKELFAQYAARLPWKLELKELDIKKTMEPPRRMQEEARLLLAATEGYGRRMLLDERGKTLSSREFSAQLRDWRDAGESVAFLIGGADGVTPEIRKCADMMLSFGRLSWPHLLARGLLAEQLYRAHTLMAGHPYHRE